MHRFPFLCLRPARRVSSCFIEQSSQAESGGAPLWMWTRRSLLPNVSSPGIMTTIGSRERKSFGELCGELEHSSCKSGAAELAEAEPGGG